MKKKKTIRQRISYKSLCEAEALKVQAEISKANNLREDLAVVRQNLSDERRFTESMANLLQLVSIVDGVRQVEKQNLIDVYQKQNTSWRPPGRNWEIDRPIGNYRA